MPRRTSDHVADLFGRARAGDAAAWECMITRLSVLPWSGAPRAPAARGGLCRRRTEHLAAVAGGGAHARHPGHRRAEPVAGLLRQRTGLPPGHGPPGGAPARHLYDQRAIPARTTQRQPTPGRCTAAGRAGPARPCRLPSSPVRSPRRWTKSSSPPAGRHLLRAGQQWPGCATEPGDGVPAVPVVRPVNWWDVLVDDPAATAGARLPRSWCGSSPRPAERRALGGLPQAALDRSLRRVGNRRSR